MYRGESTTTLFMKLYDSNIRRRKRKDFTTLSFRFRERFSLRRRVGCVAERDSSRRLSRVFFRSRASM
jgi:hypothetical protein